jgi:hypothetical protein
LINKLIIRENEFYCSSSASLDQRETLEQIFFFNKNQSKYYFYIKNLIELYGKPEIVEENKRLYLKLEKTDCQNLFTTVNNNLVGLVIYCRDSLDNIDLIHIAVDEKYSSIGIYADKSLVIQMINKLRIIALKIKDIKTITVKYNQKRIINI